MRRTLLFVLAGLFASGGLAADALTCQEEHKASGKTSLRPVYSAESRKLGEQGRVMLRVSVNALGFPEDVQVLDSSGYLRLDEAALEAVRTWCFIPAERDGASVAAQLVVPLVFSLPK